MKIAIDISPLQTGHKVRGVGFYLEYLKRSLLKHYPENDYIFFVQEKEIPQDVDLVHYPYFDPFFRTLPLIKKHKTVVTVHDLTPLVFPQHFPAGIKGKLIWETQKIVLKQVDAIITDSHASKKDILKLVGIPDEKVSVAYLAAGEEFRVIKSSGHKAIKIKYNLPEKFVLYVGDVTWNKNIPRLIQAIQEIDVPIVMIGKALIEKNFDTTNQWNKSLVTFHELIKDDNRIIRLGFIPTEDVVAIYNLATVLALPSLYEGFGLPLVEAMQCGCPIVTTDDASIPEIVDNAAMYVDGYDSHSIARGIKRVFSDKKLQTKLSIAGLHNVKSFSWKKTAEETIAVYNRVIKS